MAKAYSITVAVNFKTQINKFAASMKSAGELAKTAFADVGKLLPADEITRKLNAIAATYISMGHKAKIGFKAAEDGVQSLELKIKDFDVHSEEGIRIIETLRQELQKLGATTKTSAKNELFTIPGGSQISEWGRISMQVFGSATQKKAATLGTTLTRVAAGFKTAGAAAAPIIGIFAGVANVVVSVYAAIARLIVQLVKIPINIVLSLGKAFANMALQIAKLPLAILKSMVQHIGNLAIKIAKIPLNIVQKLGQSFLSLGKSILAIPKNAFQGLVNSLKNVGTIIAGMVGFYGIKSIGRQLADVIEGAGSIESVRVEFENFLQQARGHIDGFTSSSNQMIVAMSKITGGALDLTTMLKQSNLAMSLIGEQVATKLPEMLAVAQAAALTTGQDLTYMFESMVKGIGRLSTRWVDNLGISIHAEEEYDRVAKELNKTASALTQAERVQAFLNATMREGAKIIERTGDISLFLSTQMGALKTNMVNTRDAVISNFAPLFTVLLGYLNEFAAKSFEKVNSWSAGFIDGFARIPRGIEGLMAGISLDVGIGSKLAQQMAVAIQNPLDNAHEIMGYRAAGWAIDALKWGANVGGQFVAGIVSGFMQLISGAMNLIAGVLTSWFAPGSPPKILPDIDIWGEEAIGQWVKGMLNYPVSAELPKIKKELEDTLGRDVQDSLYQEAVDSMAAWARGLSITDMEFLTKSIDRAITKAQILNDELTKSYKKQSTTLFKMLVLQKDPAAIKTQITKTKTTKAALDANTRELEILEARNKLVQDQLELLRQLQAAIEKQNQATAKEKAGVGAGETSAEELLDEILKPILGTSMLGARIAGIKQTLGEIFSGPIALIRKSFTDNIGLVTTSWDNLVRAFGVSKPGILALFDDIKARARSAFRTVADFFLGMAQGITGKSMIEQLPEQFDEYRKGIPQLWDALEQGSGDFQFGELFGKALTGEGIDTFFVALKEKIVAFAEDTGITSKINELTGRIQESFRIAINNVKGFFYGFANEIFGTAFSTIPASTFKDLEEHVPNIDFDYSKLMPGAEAGGVFGQTIIIAVTTFVETVKAELEKLSTDTEIGKGIRTFFEKIGEGISGFWSVAGEDTLKLIDNLTKLGDAILGLFSSTIDVEERTSGLFLIGKLIGKAAQILIWPVDQMVQLLTKITTAIDDFLRASEQFSQGKLWEGWITGAEGLGELDEIYSAPGLALLDVVKKNLGKAAIKAIPGAELISMLLPQSTKDAIGTWFAGLGDDIDAGLALALGTDITRSEATQQMVDDLENDTRDALGANSPSTVFAAIGKDILLGLLSGIIAPQNIALVTTGLGAFMIGILAEANKSLDSFTAFGANLLTAIGDGISAGIDTAVTAASTAIAAIKTVLSGGTYQPQPTKPKGAGEDKTPRGGAGKQQGNAAGAGVGAGLASGLAGINIMPTLSAILMPEDLRGTVEEWYSTLSLDMITGMSSGITSFGALAITEITTLVQNLIAEVYIELGGAPSRKFYKIAQDMLLGMILGMRAYVPTLLIELRKTIDLMISAMKGYFPLFASLGEYLSQGLAHGIDAGAHWAEEAARRAVQRALAAMDDEAQSHSPSKVTQQTGKWMMEGLALGIENAQDNPYQAAISAMSHVLGAMNPTPAAATASGWQGSAYRPEDRNGTTQVILNGPIVENMIVPNMQVGDAMIRKINDKIGDAVKFRRTP
jgi:hypothetical protein